jgi:hypothetical protein
VAPGDAHVITSSSSRSASVMYAKAVSSCHCGAKSSPYG